MERWKWLAIAIVSGLAAYFGHKLTSNWSGSAIAGVGSALVLSMLSNGQWVGATIALFGGIYLVFNLLGEAPRSPAKTAAPTQAVPAIGEPQDRSALSSLLDSAKSGAQRIKGDAAAPAAAASAPVDGDNKAVIKDCTECPQLVVIPGGQFSMGRDAKQASGADAMDPREGPARTVQVRSFAAGRFAVTKGEFAAFVHATQYKTEAEEKGGCLAMVGGNWENNRKFSWRQAGFAQADNHPAVCISWNDAQAYIRWISQASHHNYRLLSEAEREYASRAGTSTSYWWGDALTPERANYDHKAAGHHGTVAVNSFSANAFGLYNVHGNVWEWVQDCQHETYAGAPADGRPWEAKCSGNARVLRGGAWVGDPAGLRATSRGWFAPDFRFFASGFRVARDVGKRD